ncbi:MAG: AraC family transcriptional regulator [Filimonas sp.]|nr:AraC family transcriptional regulator [Filimonas sp.]
MNRKDLSDYKRLSLLDGVELLYARNHTLDFPSHTHNTFNIALIINQSFNAKLPDKFLQAPVGTLCITNPDEVHATPCDKSTGNSFITFYIPPDVLTRINKGNPVFFKDKVIYHKKLFASFYYLSQNLSVASGRFETLLTASLTALVREYATEITFANATSRLFHTFLAEESFKKFSLDKAAKNLGLDKYKFLRLFKQETGLTPNSFVILKRIETAKKLILAQNDLLDVALSSGFYDAAHLIREFKKYTGVTPRIYRDA